LYSPLNCSEERKRNGHKVKKQAMGMPAPLPLNEPASAIRRYFRSLTAIFAENYFQMLQW